jgi:DNA-directed RNA polymerase specialized sigma24 family protein
MPEHSDNSWPPLGDDGYSDEYGRIEPEIYEAARGIWPEAETFASATLRDGAAGRTLLMKAAANVSRAHTSRPHEITNLRAYLFKAFKYLVLAELRKRRLHEDLNAQAYLEAASSAEASAEELHRKILIEQLMLTMDPWTREVFELRVLGYDFDEIGRERRMLAASVRNRFNKSIESLARRLQGGGLPPG